MFGRFNADGVRVPLVAPIAAYLSSRLKPAPRASSSILKIPGEGWRAGSRLGFLSQFSWAAVSSRAGQFPICNGISGSFGQADAFSRQGRGQAQGQVFANVWRKQGLGSQQDAAKGDAGMFESERFLLAAFNWRTFQLLTLSGVTLARRTARTWSSHALCPLLT